MRFTLRTTAFTLAITGAIAAGAYGTASFIVSEDVPDAAEEFFAAWSGGDLDKASKLTTDPHAALLALKAYKNHVPTTSVDFAAHDVQGRHVPFTVTAHVSAQDAAGSWAYESQLDVRDEPREGERVVWKPSVIHPELAGRTGYTLKAVATAPETAVLSREGTALDKQDHPGLSQVIDQLKKRLAAQAGAPALSIRLTPQFSDGESTTVAHVVEGKPGTIRTTIDPALQQVAEAAVAEHPGASVVAVQPSTGEVLTVATSANGELNPALEGVEAPGSVFEIVTAAALLEQGAVSPTTATPCPDQATVAGTAFTNPELKNGGAGGTFADAFAASCDTAFVRLADELAPGALAKEAKEVFGLGLNWQAGITTSDGAVPRLTGADRAAAAVGRGEVRLNVLNLASITATVRSGAFKQPRLVAADMAGVDPAQAGRPLSGTVARQLRALMNHNASRGTGAPAMSGSDGAFGSMAGLAERGTGHAAQGWFTAFDGDIAVASAVSARGEGVAYAGAVSRAVLDAGN
ncbi:penicillin-binding transpeptidase domain-containing protein [Streptomyces parvus]|uniref:penicillin-binding transpeptidase domain-containing protein n=1 Tax=Streptomyces parvus TaxID=66428 RepID=UPI002100CF0B|nr:penicillin-binding transpeptidase domain-containing protein [Streptomyces parvus]MCQ1576632.1 penicillin-binding transpeptidase domain-containing protein [Streptomyces parvus]